MLFRTMSVSSGDVSVVTGDKLNLGCGLDYRDGYINVDFHANHRVDMNADVTNLCRIKDESCVEALAQDVLEHLHRVRCKTALQEWNRVLKINGRLLVRVPSLLDQLNMLKEPGRQSYEEQSRLILNLFGTQGYLGDYHLNGFTEVTLRHELEEAGFCVESLRVMHGWLFDVVARKKRHVSPEHFLHSGTDSQFLEQVYQKLLGRSVDPGALNYYLEVLESGTPRESVIDTLEKSEEYRNRLK